MRQPYELIPVVDVLAEEAAGSLQGAHSRRVSVRAEVDGAWATRTRILPVSSSDPSFLTRTARRLLLDILEHGGGECEVTGVAVELGGLGPAKTRQGGLFAERPRPYLAARGVHRRFPDAIRRAIVIDGAVFDEDRVRFEPFPEVEPPRSRRRRAA
ncbi:MAG: hypothetical protein AAFQ53_00115 [Bacteroidota bacterium]